MPEIVWHSSLVSAVREITMPLLRDSRQSGLAHDFVNSTGRRFDFGYRLYPVCSFETVFPAPIENVLAYPVLDRAGYVLGTVGYRSKTHAYLVFRPAS